MAPILKPRLCNFQVYVGGLRVIPSPLSFNLYLFEKKKTAQKILHHKLR